jgi:Protein of unknown function (DUF2809)
MSFLKAPKILIAVLVLLFAFVVETAQYFNFVTFLGLQHSKLARVVIGNSFAVEDLITYLCGFLFILLIEYLLKNKN